jgi:hypothetical protein
VQLISKGAPDRTLLLPAAPRQRPQKHRPGPQLRPGGGRAAWRRAAHRQCRGWGGGVSQLAGRMSWKIKASPVARMQSGGNSSPDKQFPGLHPGYQADFSRHGQRRYTWTSFRIEPTGITPAARACRYSLCLLRPLSARQGLTGRQGRLCDSCRVLTRQVCRLIIRGGLVMAKEELKGMLATFVDGSGFGEPEARRNAEQRAQILAAIGQQEREEKAIALAQEANDIARVANQTASRSGRWAMYAAIAAVIALLISVIGLQK